MKRFLISFCSNPNIFYKNFGTHSVKCRMIFSQSTQYAQYAVKTCICQIGGCYMHHIHTVCIQYTESNFVILCRLKGTPSHSILSIRRNRSVYSSACVLPLPVLYWVDADYLDWQSYDSELIESCKVSLTRQFFLKVLSIWAIHFALSSRLTLTNS